MKEVMNMKTHFKIIFVFIAAICLMGMSCKNNNPPSTTTTTMITPLFTFGVQSLDGDPWRPISGTQISVTSDAGQNYNGTADTNGIVYFKVSKGTYHVNITKTNWMEYDVDVVVDHDFNNGNPNDPKSLYLAYMNPSVKIRKGIVKTDGKHFKDNDGNFYPLGATLFWSLRGWKFEQERLKQNLQFLAKHKFDYVRILGEVDWAGNDIDPAWPDYEKNLGEFLDYAYDHYGLRSEITIIGGGHESQAMALTQKIINVVKSRQEKILNFEMANESELRNISLDTMKSMAKLLKQNLSNIVAISSVEGIDHYMPGSSGTDKWTANVKSVYMNPGDLITVHLDRAYGDGGWRAVRQPWDFKDFSFPASSNEPIGPRSSVAEEVDPIRLSMLRAVGIINGVEAFVLHNGAGVAGKLDPAHNRPANLWEVPGIDAIMNAVRKVDELIPQNVSGGQHWNNAWAGNPWVADAFWGDGDNHGVNRNYTVAYGDGWISTEAGIKDYVMLKALKSSTIEVFDILKGKITTVDVNAGSSYKLVPDSRDSNGYGAFIIKGHFK